MNRTALLPYGTLAAALGRPLETVGWVSLVIASVPGRGHGLDIRVVVPETDVQPDKSTTVMPFDFAANRLNPIEALTTAGHWSSSPRKHDSDNWPREALLEQTLAPTALTRVRPAP